MSRRVGILRSPDASSQMGMRGVVILLARCSAGGPILKSECVPIPYGNRTGGSAGCRGANGTTAGGACSLPFQVGLISHHMP